MKIPSGLAISTIVILAAAGCSGRTATQSLILHVLADRRDACEALGSSMSAAWSSAIKFDMPADSVLAGTLLDVENQQRLSRAEIRKKQAGTLFENLGKGSDSDAGRTLLDIGSQVEALCSMSRNPAGFSLITFNTKRSELRVDLDKGMARAAILIPALKESPERTALDNEVSVAERRLNEEVAAKLKSAEEKKRSEEAAAAEAASAQRAEQATAQMARDAAQAEQLKLEEAAAAKRRLALDELDRQRRVAYAEQIRQDCASSREWLSQHGKELRVVAVQANRMSCDQLSAAATGSRSLKAPSGASGLVENLSKAFDEAARACTARNRMMVVSSRAHIESSMSRLSELGSACGLQF